MARKLSLPLLSLTLFLMVTACTGAEEPASPAERTVTLADSGQVHTLEDDLRLLGEINRVIPLDRNRLIVADASPGVSLFEDRVMTRTFGNDGEGPCEYNRITAMDVSGDSLFVLPLRQSKIITYRISTGECLGETGHQSLSAATYLARAGGAFHTARTQYNQATADSATLLFRHGEGGEPHPLPVTKGTLNPVDTPVPMHYPGHDFARSGDLLFAFYPFTGKIVTYEAGTGTAGSFPLRLNIPREEMERADDPQGILDLINNQLEFVWRLFATDRWLVASVVHKNGPNADQTRGLQFYTHEGSFIGEVTVEDSPVALSGNRVIFLHTVEDPSSDYSYEVEYREFKVE